MNSAAKVINIILMGIIVAVMGWNIIISFAAPFDIIGDGHIYFIIALLILVAALWFNDNVVKVVDMVVLAIGTAISVTQMSRIASAIPLTFLLIILSRFYIKNVKTRIRLYAIYFSILTSLYLATHIINKVNLYIYFAYIAISAITYIILDIIIKKEKNENKTN